nr:ribonuclease H-like domain-containing protein [Tanacetum cinerariifolium]
MGDVNLIRTLGHYSKPSHEGHMNTIELPVGNNVYCMENPEQAIVEYASSRTDEARGGDNPKIPKIFFQTHLTGFQPNGPNRSFNNNTQIINSQSNLEGLVSNFMASQDARLSKFEANFKQQQSETTNKIDTVLKAITDRMAGAFPSDTVKNPKLNVNTINFVLSACSYHTKDPQCSSHPSTSINAIKTCSKEASHSQTSLLQIGMWIGTGQTKEPKSTLEHEFHDLHLNLPILEVLAHTPIYNVMLDIYVESLELGKNRSTFIQGEVSTKMEDPGIFTLLKLKWWFEQDIDNEGEEDEEDEGGSEV